MDGPNDGDWLNKRQFMPLTLEQRLICQGTQRQIEMVTVRKERLTHSLFSSPIQALTHEKPDRQTAYANTL